MSFSLKTKSAPGALFFVTFFYIARIIRQENSNYHIMTQKNLNLGLGAILLILLGVIGYALLNGKPQSTIQSNTIQANTQNSEPETSTANTESTKTSEEPATMKTYTNSKFGFSFQYPQDWEIYEETYNTEIVTAGINVFAGTKQNISGKKSPAEGTSGMPTQFMMSATQLSRATAVATDCQYSPEEGLKFTAITIDKIKTNKCTAPSMFGTLMFINFDNSNKFFSIRTDDYEGSVKQTVDKILPTIKIIKTVK